MKDRLEQIIDFIENQCGINRKRIQRQSSIAKDLKITGQDAIELIVVFGKRFKVDVSKFNAVDYVEPEGMNWIVGASSPSKKDLTVAHLERALELGRLDNEVFNSMPL